MITAALITLSVLVVYCLVQVEFVSRRHNDTADRLHQLQEDVRDLRNKQ